MGVCGVVLLCLGMLGGKEEGFLIFTFGLFFGRVFSFFFGGGTLRSFMRRMGCIIPSPLLQYCQFKLTI